MKPTLVRELALDALLMALWRRKPKARVIVHSDQGSQYGSDYWKRFCAANNLERQHESARQLLGYSVHYPPERQPNLTRAGIGLLDAFALTCRLAADVS